MVLQVQMMIANSVEDRTPTQVNFILADDNPMQAVMLAALRDVLDGVMAKKVDTVPLPSVTTMGFHPIEVPQ